MVAKESSKKLHFHRQVKLFTNICEYIKLRCLNKFWIVALLIALLGVNVGGLTCHHGSPFVSVLLHMKWGFFVQIKWCRLAQNTVGMCCSSFYWMHKFRESKHLQTVLSSQENPLKAHCPILMCAAAAALSQSHSFSLGWSLCQCGPLWRNYCHSWQHDSLQAIKEVLIQKHLAGYWWQGVSDRFYSHPNPTQPMFRQQISLV